MVNQKNIKLFKFLLITIFLPINFFQSSCSKKKDDKFEKETHELNKKIKDLERIRFDLASKLKPFNDLMQKYKVNNFDDLMERLTDLDDPYLQKNALILANCLLKTKTLTLLELQKKLNDEQWKKENEKDLNLILELFEKKSLDELSSNCTINNKVKILAERIAEINNTDYIKCMRNKINENKEKIIIFYLLQLWDESCTDWDSFAAKFNDEIWKNSEKNKQNISTLSRLLDCKIEQINQEKINSLDDEIKNNLLNLVRLETTSKLKELQKENAELKNNETKHQSQVRKLNGNIDNLKKQNEENEKELVSFYLVQLWDKSCTDWDSFVKKFNDEEWKNNEKNKQTIISLSRLLNCPIEQINREKINNLGESIKNKVEEFFKMKDIGKLLKVNGTESFDLKQKYNDLDGICKRIDAIRNLTETILRIDKSLGGVNMTIESIRTDKESNQTMLPERKRILNFLYETMVKLNVSDNQQLIKKIENWCELLEFIASGKTKSDVNGLLIEANDFNKWFSENEQESQSELDKSLFPPN